MTTEKLDSFAVHNSSFPPLTLVSTKTAVSYSFRAPAGSFGWACCTANDDTGELLITSDWGSWTHRWDPRPSCLGAPSLTAFIGTRGDVDYLARKLQCESGAGRRWSSTATAAALRQRLCQRRLEDGREQWEARLEPGDMPDGRPLPHLIEPRGPFTRTGLPIYSRRMPAASRAGRPWKTDGSLYEPLAYLTSATARQLWIAIGELAEEITLHTDLFYDRILQIEDFTDYVTWEPWQYSQTEQTAEDRALREAVLPALISACRDRVIAQGSPPAENQAEP